MEELLHTDSASTVTTSPFDPAVLALRILLTIVSKYAWMVIMPVGLFGNIMCILINLQKNNRRLSTCNYMMALALADSGVLIEYAWGVGWIFWATEPPSEFAQQMMYYQAYAFGTLSGIYLAEMTVDRLIVVRFPMAASRLCTTRRACITVTVTFVLICSLNLYVFITYKKVTNEDTGQGVLRMSLPDAPELETLGYASQLIFGTILPFCVIITCNAWIIIVLRNASKERGIMGIGKEGQKIREKETTHLTRMLILVSIAYVLLSIPFRLYELFIGVESIAEYYNMNEEYWQLRYISQHFTMLMFWELNYGINFYLYCIGGGLKYRNEAKKLLRHCQSK